MDHGYHSDPTTSSLAESVRHQHLRHGHHPSHSQSQSQSQSMDPALSFSLSAGGQSTPSKVTAADRTTPVSTNSSNRVRVSRRGGPPTAVPSLSTASESSLASLTDVDAEVDVDGSETEYAPTRVAQQIGSSAQPMQHHWQQLLAADTPLSAIASSAGARMGHTPSTGSSTLVDHDHDHEHEYNSRNGAAQRKAVLTAQHHHGRPNSAPPTANISTGPSNTSSTTTTTATTRRSPLQHHIDQFVPSHASSQHNERSISTTPQASLLHSHSQLLRQQPPPLTTSTSSQAHSKNLTDTRQHGQDSEVVSRVHDIFARHIRQASASHSSTLRSSLAASGTSRIDDTHATTSRSSQQRPRQRLRDLLATSQHADRESSSGRGHTSRRVQYERQDAPLQSSSEDELPQQISPIRLRNSQRATSSTPQQPSSRKQTIPRRSHLARDASSRTNSLRAVDAQRRSQRSVAPIASTGTTPDRRAELSHLAQFLEHPEPTRGSDTVHSDGRLTREWQDLAARSAALQLQEEQMAEDEYEKRGVANQPDIFGQEQESIPEDERDIVEQERAEEEEDSFSPSLGSQSEQNGREQYAENRQIKDDLPALPTLEASASESESDEDSVPAHPRASPYHHHHLSPPQKKLSPSRTRKYNSTPSMADGDDGNLQQTPHVPGHYASSTPYQASPSKLRSRQRLASVDPADLTDLDRSRSKLLAFPGSYLSPYPLPSRQQPATRRDEQTRLPERSFRFESPKRLPQASTDFDTLLTPTKSPQKATTSSSLSNSPMRERTESSESTLQNLLSELVKPIRSLLIASPGRKKGGKTEAVADEGKQPLPLRLDAESVRGKGKQTTVEQNSILQKLAEADRLDRSLTARLDEMRQAVDEMSATISTRVQGALSESFSRESSRRRSWLAGVILCQLAMLWIIFAFATARANFAYRTTYFDPFHPTLYDAGFSVKARLVRVSSHTHFRSPSLLDVNGDLHGDWRLYWQYLSAFLQGLPSIDLPGSDFVHGTFGARPHPASFDAGAFTIPT